MAVRKGELKFTFRGEFNHGGSDDSGVDGVDDGDDDGDGGFATNQ